MLGILLIIPRFTPRVIEETTRASRYDNEKDDNKVGRQ